MLNDEKDSNRKNIDKNITNSLNTEEIVTAKSYIPEMINAKELNHSKNLNLLKKIKQNENKNSKTNKLKKKEKKKDPKFLKKLNVSNIEGTCSKVCIYNPGTLFVTGNSEPMRCVGNIKY